ncbi:MAG: 23S rRNA (uracil(1939)-C(5))-methyltransferase RlmD [Acidaminococcales bacterium]|jgi:23S rRNA (uracil1939-C5)-methyltransferase|nr:23S rRNA (uracil(1939)-C(5))-methyltransferase RlmD [Acidaminococcales bacterium]
MTKQYTKPCQSGEEHSVAITGIGGDGEGIGRIAGFTVFVEGALPGEIVRARVRFVKKTYAAAELVSIDKASPERVLPACPLFGRCGGCQLQHLSYQAQLRAKRVKIADALERIARLAAPNVLPALSCADPWRYRNKMLFPVGGEPGRAVIGCYARASHQVVDVRDCLIQQQANNQIAAATRAWMNKYNIVPYDEAAGTGLLRHVMGRTGGASGEVMAALVVGDENIPCLPELLRDLREAVPQITSVSAIVKKDRGNAALCGKEHCLWGKPQITGRLNGFSFNISAKSFFQVNSLLAGALYAAAADMAQLSGGETVIEAYSGTGSGSVYIARAAKNLIGVELSADAVSDARENAEINGLKNVRFIAGDVSDELTRLAGQGARPDVVFADPPRAGLSRKALEGIIKLNPRVVIYTSCNPFTLARDVALLAGKYRAEEFLPVDMFPMTAHIECVGKLVRAGG